MADPLVRRCRALLGTFVEIAVPAGHDAAVDAAFGAVAHVHAIMSFHEPESDLAALRRAPLGRAVRVDPQTVEVLHIAADLHRRSNGLFDVAIGADLVATGFLPAHDGTEPGAMTGTTGDIVITGDDSVTCLAPMLIDLGGIAKGYAVDRATDALASAGVPHAIVNAGGDLRVLGDVPQIIHVDDGNGQIHFSMEVADAAVASSCNHHNRRRAETGTVTPHLGFNRTSLLVDRTVTVIADRCVIADAMTKVAMADPELASTMLRELGGMLVDHPAGRVPA